MKGQRRDLAELDHVVLGELGDPVQLAQVVMWERDMDHGHRWGVLVPLGIASII